MRGNLTTAHATPTLQGSNLETRLFPLRARVAQRQDRQVRVHHTQFVTMPKNQHCNEIHDPMLHLRDGSRGFRGIREPATIPPQRRPGWRHSLSLSVNWSFVRLRPCREKDIGRITNAPKISAIESQQSQPHPSPPTSPSTSHHIVQKGL